MLKFSGWYLTAITLSLILWSIPGSATNIKNIYLQHCATCHGEDRLGGMGPALLPENLKRLPPNQAEDVIRSGRANTQMPAFGEKINNATITELTEFVYQPLESVPLWHREEIDKSHISYRNNKIDLSKPVYSSDPMNLFVVVEAGDHHITILDGDKLEPVHRFKTRLALHGGAKYSPDGRYVYFVSRDGWVAKYDLYSLEYVAETRAGINTRNIAISRDGRFVIVGNFLPHTLVILDARDLQLIEIIHVVDDFGKSSRVSAVYDAPPRESFIVALKDLTEIWEIPYGVNAEPVYSGLVHDYQFEEGIPDQRPFPVRRIRLDDYLDDFFFDDKYENLIGAARNNKNGQVINMIVGKKIADIDITGLPHLGSGISWVYKGKKVIGTPNLSEGIISIIDTTSWQVIKRIETLGPGFFMRSHENSPYSWVDVFFGPHKDVIHVIDNSTLEIVKTLKPAPGKVSAHVEFTRDGRYALLSIWDEEGAIVVYDARTLKEIKWIPMNKPSGKYNVYNKTHLSSGTSH